MDRGTFVKWMESLHFASLWRKCLQMTLSQDIPLKMTTILHYFQMAACFEFSPKLQTSNVIFREVCTRTMRLSNIMLANGVLTCLQATKSPKKLVWERMVHAVGQEIVDYFSASIHSERIKGHSKTVLGRAKTFSNAESEYLTAMLSRFAYPPKQCWMSSLPC